MERIVRILNQSPLATRQYPDKKTGEQKVINSVTLKLTDGTDTFLGEITGERASLLPPCTIPLGHPSAPAPSILYHASNLDWLFWKSQTTTRFCRVCT